MNINSKNITNYIYKKENDTIEFKAIVPKNFLAIYRTISAFANTNGGYIFFGIDERSNKVIGIDPKQIKHIKQELENSDFAQFCSIYNVSFHKKIISIIEVPKHKSVLYYNGTSFYRRDDSNIKFDGPSCSKLLKDFVREIQYENRNPKDTARILSLLKEKDSNPERIIDVNTKLFRGRVFRDNENNNNKDNFFGYDKENSFVPSREKTVDLRANYRYIPYLYCANHPYIALLEVRPRLSSKVSIATIIAKKQLRLLDFCMSNIPKNMTDTKQNLFYDLSVLFSKPITSNDEVIDYIPTQYIAEYVKNLGYDGISFRSSLAPELNSKPDKDLYNVVVFKYDKCDVIGSNLVKVNENFLKCEQIDSDTKKLELYPD